MIIMHLAHSKCVLSESYLIINHAQNLSLWSYFNACLIWHQVRKQCKVTLASCNCHVFRSRMMIHIFDADIMCSVCSVSAVGRGTARSMNRFPYSHNVQEHSGESNTHSSEVPEYFLRKTTELLLKMTWKQEKSTW